MGLTVDANVWIAAADSADEFHAVSRQFLAAAAQQRHSIYLPAFARLEIACALARRLQNAETGPRLANAILHSPQVTVAQLDTSFLSHALTIGTRAFLRGTDTLYAATAAIHAAQLVSWDDELIRRAGAVTPAQWLTAPP